MTRYSQKQNNTISSSKDEREETDGAIRYIKFSGDYDKFDELRENKKSIVIKKGYPKIPDKRGRKSNRK